MESVVNDYEINFWVIECSARMRHVDSDQGSNPALLHENRMVYQWLYLSEPKERQMLVTAGSVADMAFTQSPGMPINTEASKRKYWSTGFGEFQLLGKFLASWDWGINPGSLSGVERGPHWESKVFFFFFSFLAMGKAKSLRTCNL